MTKKPSYELIQNTFKTTKNEVVTYLIFSDNKIYDFALNEVDADKIAKNLLEKHPQGTFFVAKTLTKHFNSIQYTPTVEKFL